MDQPERFPHLSCLPLPQPIAVSSQDTASQRTGFITDSVDRWGSCLQSFGLVHIIHGETATVSNELYLLTQLPLSPPYAISDHETASTLRERRPDTADLEFVGKPPGFMSSVETCADTNRYDGYPALCPPAANIIPSPIIPVSLKHGSRSESDYIFLFCTHRAKLDRARTYAHRPLKSNSPLDRQHGLQRLTMTTEHDQEHEGTQPRPVCPARRLLPRIHDITGLHHHDEERWAQLHEVVQAVQAVRAEPLYQGPPRTGDRPGCAEEAKSVPAELVHDRQGR
ncbi:hypothetical protein FA15DRAFT_710799 [Coprinopsis marcescibilis]|uniref:Uncharacterized protein n=1 Tax=Coprinopsis marcescibilis TaxID=230819 RepID=A0A5C3KBH4_COPMA|nr:hypothetical protein FA15DRAFT_710799 [Coprinopsis marcescibilis]